MDAAVPAPALALARTFAGILTGLRHAIAPPAAKNPLLAALALLLWPRLNRLAARFTRLAGRVAAGTAAPRRRALQPSAARPSAARARKPYRRLPRRFAWLVRLVPEAAAFGSQLQYLLATPEMADVLAAAPQAGRLLRPLCRTLGVRPPPVLTPPPRPARPPKPPRRGATPRQSPARPAAPLTPRPPPPTPTPPRATPPPPRPSRGQWRPGASARR